MLSYESSSKRLSFEFYYENCFTTRNQKSENDNFGNHKYGTVRWMFRVGGSAL